MKKILIFGITGSIGQQSLECLENFQLVGFSYNSNYDKAMKIKQIYSNAEIFSPSISDMNTVDSYEELIIKTKPDLILNAIVGFEGIKITHLALKYKINLALANKESLVVAGDLINKMLAISDIKIYPVDSEHSSLFELVHCSQKNINTIYITASGGPFYTLSNPYSPNIKFNDAIKHPNWNMGYKISIDSATMINKCFEMIEAHFLYPNYKIEAYIHPQSIVHSFVQFSDHSYWLNASYPDMKHSINLAINEFKNSFACIPELNFDHLSLEFQKIDIDKWVPIKWAYEVINNNKHIIGLIICVLDDILIEFFKNDIIKYNHIIEIIQFFIDKYSNEKIKNWDDIYFWKNKLILECKILIEDHYGKN